MRIRKTLIAGLALAIAIAFSPLPELQAATFVSPGSQPGRRQSDHVVKDDEEEQAKRRRPRRKARKRGKRARARPAVRHLHVLEQEERKCVDARLKK